MLSFTTLVLETPESFTQNTTDRFSIFFQDKSQGFHIKKKKK